MKRLLLLVVLALTFLSCEKDSGETYQEYLETVASKKVLGLSEGFSDLVTPVFLVKQDNDTEWTARAWEIPEFNYESGYEYVLKISRQTKPYEGEIPQDGSSVIETYTLLEVVSKVKKESKGMPEHLIPEWHPDYPKK